MLESNVKESIESKKIKNSERLTLTELFKLIYNQRTIPEQWLVSKPREGVIIECPLK